NILLSLVLIKPFGLTGIAFGTFVSMVYYIIYVVLYLSRNIINRSIKFFLKNIFVDILIFSVILLVGNKILAFMEIDSFFQWVSSAIICGILFIIVSGLINYLFYKKNLVF